MIAYAFKNSAQQFPKVKEGDEIPMGWSYKEAKTIEKHQIVFFRDENSIFEIKTGYFDTLDILERTASIDAGKRNSTVV